jgi:hypothetical protein
LADARYDQQKSNNVNLPALFIDSRDCSRGRGSDWNLGIALPVWADGRSDDFNHPAGWKQHSWILPVKPFIGPERSGTIFGTVEGDRAKVSLLSVKNSGRSDLLMTMTFIDGRIVDENTLTGTFYVYDNEGTALSGSYEATRK